jgi:hypothetical protein
MPGDLQAHGRGHDIEVQIAHRDVGDHELAGFAVGREIPAETGGHAGQLRAGVLEGDVQAIFSPFYTLDEPAHPEDRLAGRVLTQQQQHRGRSGVGMITKAIREQRRSAEQPGGVAAQHRRLGLGGQAEGPYLADRVVAAHVERPVRAQ